MVNQRIGAEFWSFRQTEGSDIENALRHLAERTSWQAETYCPIFSPVGEHFLQVMHLAKNATDMCASFANIKTFRSSHDLWHT